MARQIHRLCCALSRCALSIVILAGPAAAATTWNGVLRYHSGTPVSGAVVKLHAPTGKLDYTARTSPEGVFSFVRIIAGDYVLSVRDEGKTWTVAQLVEIKDGTNLSAGLQILPNLNQLRVIGASGNSLPWASGGESLSSEQVSSLPLNERDFGKLLLLAAGTMSDTNGSANFTQQFAVNGQRAVASVFAIDGIDTTDPEMG
ncbi:MAG TPA: carboxypeptidase-like regulatory domain-containing protein, partial [Terriglobia bacterium]|nr:carboxypeptidase-like regulatory domain-containing protein [Terriglobia bacterium]